MGPNQNQNYSPPAQPPAGPNPGIPIVTPPPNKKHGHPMIVIVGLAVALLATIGFGVWSFLQYQDQKNNVDTIAQERVDAALVQQQEDLEAEFTTRNERVVNNYTGPSEFGSASFKYPRDWSIFVADSNSSTPLSVFGAPGSVNEESEAFALRLEVVDRSYSETLQSFDRSIDDGSITTSVYQNSGQTGIKLSGEIERETQGQMVLLPLRDRTLKFWTESNQFTNVYNQALETLTFTP